MSILQILTYPDLKLRERARELSASEIVQGSIQKLIDDLVDTMIADDGIGIAATQVGQPFRLFILGGKTKAEAQVFINPNLSSFSPKETYMEEGCLSVPGVYGIVKRPAKVRLKSLDRHGKKVDVKASGLIARVFQHEMDHLDGILFIDKVERITAGSIESLEKGIVPKKTKNKDIAL